MLVGRKPGWSKRGVEKFENLLEACTEKEDGNLLDSREGLLQKGAIFLGVRQGRRDF